MVVVATLMSSRGFGEGLAKVGGSPVWAARPWDTLFRPIMYLILSVLIIVEGEIILLGAGDSFGKARL
jgi:hypothetical protein